MTSILANWKTSLGGIILIALGAASSFLGVKVPGFNLDFTAALTAGLALLFAKDGNVTGGTTPR